MKHLIHAVALVALLVAAPLAVREPLLRVVGLVFRGGVDKRL